MARGSAARRPVVDSEPDPIEHDFDILEAIGRYHDAASEGLGQSRLEETIRGWIAGREPPDSSDAAMRRIMGMAVDLVLFTPSLSGTTPIDRFLRGVRPTTPDDKEAFAALGGARFCLVKVVGRETSDLVRLTDKLSGEELVLLDARLSPLAAGMDIALRLCPLASGRHVAISVFLGLDGAMLAQAMGFVKPGKGLSNAYRCAAALYREAARHGAIVVPILSSIAEGESLLDRVALSEVQGLALAWLSLNDDAEAEEGLASEVRRFTSVGNLVDALGCYGTCGPDAPAGLEEAFARIAEIQMETIIRRGAAGREDPRGLFDEVAAEVDRHVARGAMNHEARGLFNQLKTRLSFAGPKTSQAVSGSELERVLQRIQALRAKTVDLGCTEEEALAAAAKVAELLDRYGLTLDEANIREEICEGIGVSTDRRRPAPVDACVQVIAAFCDCKAWGEKTASGTLRFVFFGLKADVQAARFLHELITVTFESETWAFRKGEIYSELAGGDRRTASNSFQLGLANGINAKLMSLKADRHAAMVKTSGRDLVPLKTSVVEEELEKLGMNFVSKGAKRKRYVDAQAYRAGDVAGRAFEPHRRIGEVE